MLDLRCTQHPGYTGEWIPGDAEGSLKVLRLTIAPLGVTAGGGGCGDCWEKYRLVQAAKGNPEAR